MERSRRQYQFSLSLWILHLRRSLFPYLEMETLEVMGWIFLDLLFVVNRTRLSLSIRPSDQQCGRYDPPWTLSKHRMVDDEKSLS